jgi:hypothetical protein
LLQLQEPLAFFLDHGILIEHACDFRGMRRRWTLGRRLAFVG